AQQQHGAAVEHDARALRAADHARAPVEPQLVQLVEARLEVGGHAGERFGAPSGRGGTAAFLWKRSWLDGSHSRTWSVVSASSSSSTTSGVSPSSQPERLSGRGFAPLSGWRATL